MTANIKYLIETLRRSECEIVGAMRRVEREPLVPRIHVSGARQQEREVTAFEMERLTTLYVAHMRRLFNNLQENLPIDQRMENPASFLADTINGGLDMAANAKG